MPGIFGDQRVMMEDGQLTRIAEPLESPLDRLERSTTDWGFLRVLFASLLVHGFFMLGAHLTPRYSEGLRDDALRANHRIAAMILRPAEMDRPRPKLDLAGAKGSRAKDKAGHIGKKKDREKDTMASKAGAPRVDPNTRLRDRRVALRSGLLGFLGTEGHPSAIDNVLGSAEIGAGLNQALGGLRGLATGDAAGTGGLSTRGAQAGGGGGPLGIGSLGDGPGRGAGGPGDIDLGGPGKSRTPILPGPTIVKGSLSKSEIGRVIRRHLNRFKFCYEKELGASDGLSGKVSVHFIIAPTGEVADAKVRETSMNHEAVESCVLHVMRSLRFPAPRGGGIVVVTYPFIFQSS